LLIQINQITGLFLFYLTLFLVKLCQSNILNLLICLYFSKVHIDEFGIREKLGSNLLSLFLVLSQLSLLVLQLCKSSVCGEEGKALCNDQDS